MSDVPSPVAARARKHCKPIGLTDNCLPYDRAIQCTWPDNLYSCGNDRAM